VLLQRCGRVVVVVVVLVLVLVIYFHEFEDSDNIVVNVSNIVYEALWLDTAHMTMEEYFKFTYKNFQRLHFVTPVNQPFEEDRHRLWNSTVLT
jgi:hypothetical protein